MREQQVRARGRAVGRGQRDRLVIDASSTDWMLQGKCAQPGADPEDWFAPRRGRPVDGIDGAELNGDDARKLCRGCPIIERCAMYAIDNRIDHGVWGGMTPYMRHRDGARMQAAAGERDAS